MLNLFQHPTQIPGGFFLISWRKYVGLAPHSYLCLNSLDSCLLILSGRCLRPRLSAHTAQALATATPKPAA